MPDLPTTEQLDEIEQRSDKCDEARSDGTSSAAYVAAWMAESANDVPQLLAWIRTMQPGYALLGHARRALDQAADRENGCLPEVRVAAADLAQRITDEIGHPQTDEPALGPDLRAENQRLNAKVERLKAAVVSALRRGDNYAAALDRARSDLAAAQAAAGCTCQDPDRGPEPALGSVSIVVDALMAAAGGLSEQQLAGQVTAWVRPCRRAGLAARLVAALADARRAEKTLRAQLAEVTADAGLVRRSHEELLRWLDSERSARWRPKAWPVRPLTPEQERSVVADEARTDWPAWVEPCDPAITPDGGALWLSCAGDEHAGTDRPTPIVLVEPGDRWSELVAAVVAHRCQPAASGQTGDTEAQR